MVRPPWWSGREARQRTANPSTRVQIPSPPRAIGAAVARFLDTEEVTGSNPVSPTRFVEPPEAGLLLEPASFHVRTRGRPREAARPDDPYAAVGVSREGRQDRDGPVSVRKVGGLLAGSRRRSSLALVTARPTTAESARSNRPNRRGPVGSSGRLGGFRALIANRLRSGAGLGRIGTDAATSVPPGGRGPRRHPAVSGVSPPETGQPHPPTRTTSSVTSVTRATVRPTFLGCAELPASPPSSPPCSPRQPSR